MNVTAPPTSRRPVGVEAARGDPERERVMGASYDEESAGPPASSARDDHRASEADVPDRWARGEGTNRRGRDASRHERLARAERHAPELPEVKRLLLREGVLEVHEHVERSDGTRPHDAENARIAFLLVHFRSVARGGGVVRHNTRATAMRGYPGAAIRNAPTRVVRGVVCPAPAT